MGDPATGWADGFNAQQAWNTMYENIHDNAVTGFTAGAIAGGFSLTPGGVVGGAIVGLDTGILVGAVLGADHVVRDMIRSRTDTGVSEYVHGNGANSLLQALQPNNLSDGSRTFNYMLGDIKLSVNSATGAYSMLGSARQDHLIGVAGKDTLNGGDGNDVIDGHQKGDYLIGGNGGDIINGGSGKDKIIGNADHDLLTGGIGDDVFYFAGSHVAKDSDKITDFELGIDEIAAVEHINGWDTVTVKGVVYATSFTTDYGNEIDLKTRMGLGDHDWSAKKMNEVLNDDAHHMFG